MSVLTEAPIVNELPMSPLGYGLLAIGTFAVLLAITFAFRSVGTRHGGGPGQNGTGPH
jgi:hypothetical protein